MSITEFNGEECILGVVPCQTPGGAKFSYISWSDRFAVLPHPETRVYRLTPKGRKANTFKNMLTPMIIELLSARKLSTDAICTKLSEGQSGIDLLFLVSCIVGVLELMEKAHYVISERTSVLYLTRVK